MSIVEFLLSFQRRLALNKFRMSSRLARRGKPSMPPSSSKKPGADRFQPERWEVALDLDLAECHSWVPQVEPQNPNCPLPVDGTSAICPKAWPSPRLETRLKSGIGSSPRRSE